jgi:hypothetical protein
MKEGLDPHPCPFLCHLLWCSSMQHSGNINHSCSHNKIYNHKGINCSVVIIKIIWFKMSFEVLIAVKMSVLVF